MIDWLPDLLLLETYDSKDKYIEVLYEYFHLDFIVRAPMFRGTKISLKKYPLSEDGKEATFWHLITEGHIERNRILDIRRCERIRWPRPIIENCELNEIKIWKNKRKGENRICIWFENAEYLVILAERKGYTLLWTAYPVIMEHRKKKLNKEYEEYLKAGDAHKGGAVTPSTPGR